MNSALSFISGVILLLQKKCGIRYSKPGKQFGIEPVGLGCRDTLRLEKGYCLYGNDIDKTTNPIEASLGWITKTNKGIFNGSDVIVKVKEEKPKRKLVGFMLETEKFIPRH